MKINKNYIVIILVLCAIGLVACSPDVETSVPQSEQTYTAKADGFAGDVEVSLTIKDGMLISVSATGEKETPDLGGKALEILPANMLARNSVDVDAMSGATITSNAVLEAARSAIFGTLGGIRVDEKMRVLNEDLKPIEGLYAAGQDAGGMYGYPYYETPGTTQGYAYNSGRIAGEHASEFIK